MEKDPEVDFMAHLGSLIESERAAGRDPSIRMVDPSAHPDGPQFSARSKRAQFLQQFQVSVWEASAALGHWIMESDAIPDDREVTMLTATFHQIDELQRAGREILAPRTQLRCECGGELAPTGVVKTVNPPLYEWGCIVCSKRVDKGLESIQC